ncbi:ferredoxin-NADP reductase [Fulvivirga sedimenti]|uniref:Ferredoxin-NADP reductase n=1 Tax=Fulvivirga sedimenti TaxID=2879465 RepID=A0A9X1HLD1_9BACT|nr:ferredoxin-NADP reductase [Fulvivirga sedimenti]MCA6074031.1 ferredoxin-NADP reductase [Fulvivirga sedimenti]
MAHLSDYSTDKQYQATVMRTERLTPADTEEVREIMLEVDQPDFSCQVDQSFGVLVETDGEFGNKYHHRLYSVADIPEKEKGKTHLTMLVKRCSYVDDFNGERYEGVASNYLCDRKKGDKIHITGPFELPFKVPDDKHANLILIGMGTGIAPFRAFVKHIYTDVKDWKGKVRLFYGARSGLELLYLNDKDGDLTNYYDETTFEAFHALSPRPHWSDPISLDAAIEGRAEEILEMLGMANTYIYVAGYEKVKENLDRAFSKIMGSKEKWKTRKAELIAGKKWAEVIY